MGLDIDVFRTKQSFSPFNGQSFNHIHEFATTIIPGAGITFRIFIGHHVGLGIDNRKTGIVFRGDHQEIMFLPLYLSLDCPVNIRVRFF